MPRLHQGAPADVACIWVDDSTLFQAVATRLLCWAQNSSLVSVATGGPTQHFEVPKTLCGVQGPLVFTDSGPDVCPLGDDTTVNTATPLDPTTCGPPALTDAEMTEQLSHALYDNTDQTYTGELRYEAPDDQTTGLILSQQNLTHPTNSADLVQVFAQAAKSFWLSEVGMPRVERVGTEVVLKLFAGADNTSDILQVFDTTDTITTRIAGDTTLHAPNIEVSPWTDITIDSPTVAGRYTAHTPGDGWRQPQARLTDGGDTIQLRGRIDIDTTTSANDIIATALPVLANFNGQTNVSMAPSANTRVTATSAGANIRIEILNDSRIRCLNTAVINSFELDGISISRTT